MKVIVLGGGNSPEREVSLRSAAAVSKALRQDGFEVEVFDPKDGLPDKVNSADIVFPILHGQGGEDGTIQQMLEKEHRAYLGSDSKASAICFDKNLTRQALIKSGLPIAGGDQVTIESYFGHPLAKGPHVLKVAHGGSSIGTYIVRNTDHIEKDKARAVFDLDKIAVIEEFVEGIELTVAILDHQALPVIEIVPPVDGEFDYENKYNGKTKEICPPHSISQAIQDKAQALAIKVHNVLGARHLSRVDIIAKSNGDLVVLELNTMPGMTDQSLYPLAAKVAGISMSELMNKFVSLVRNDYKLH